MPNTKSLFVLQFICLFKHLLRCWICVSQCCLYVRMASLVSNLMEAISFFKCIGTIEVTKDVWRNLTGILIEDSVNLLARYFFALSCCEQIVALPDADLQILFKSCGNLIIKIYRSKFVAFTYNLNFVPSQKK